MYSLPSRFATAPVVPLPKNGSNTVSPGLLPARIQGSMSRSGNMAKCSSMRNVFVLTSHTSRLRLYCRVSSVRYRVRLSVNALTHFRFRIFCFPRPAARVPRRRYLFDRLLNRLVIIVVFRRFRQQKYMLVAFRRAVFHALRQTVDFVPDDVRAKIIPEVSQRKREHPRDSDHVLRLDIFPPFRHLKYMVSLAVDRSVLFIFIFF